MEGEHFGQPSFFIRKGAKLHLYMISIKREMGYNGVK
jgi:hypothetical protein